MQRFLDDVLEQIHEEEEDLIHIALPDWRLYFQNFELRVLTNVTRSLGTKTLHYSVLDPLCLHLFDPRTVDRLTLSIIHISEPTIRRGI
jgi:hypothetical protein